MFATEVTEENPYLEAINFIFINIFEKIVSANEKPGYTRCSVHIFIPNFSQKEERAMIASPKINETLNIAINQESV